MGGGRWPLYQSISLPPCWGHPGAEHPLCAQSSPGSLSKRGGTGLLLMSACVWVLGSMFCLVFNPEIAWHWPRSAP